MILYRNKLKVYQLKDMMFNSTVLFEIVKDFQVQELINCIRTYNLLTKRQFKLY